MPGVPETALSEATVAALPSASPPAPWRLELGGGIVWLQRSAAGAGGVHQRGVRFDRSVPLTLAGFAEYRRSPVGSYGEVWASPTILVPGRTLAIGVPFIAVDSLPSLHGGRANWALPKCLASIGTERRAGRPSAFWAIGEDGAWSVCARVISSGVRIPLCVRSHLLQATAGGEQLLSPAAVGGVGRLGRVRVEVAGRSLPAWLAGGCHTGVVIDRATLVVGAPRGA